MKRFLALILVLFTCAAMVFLFASCDDEKDKGNTEAPTAAPLPEGVADAALIDEIKKGMTREQIRSLLGVDPIKYDDEYDRADVYIFSGGRAGYIDYHNDDTVKNITVEDMVDPSQIDQIKIGDFYKAITDIFGVDGTNTVSVYLGVFRYVLDDGRLLYIYYDERKLACSISIEGANGEVTYPYPPSAETFICDDMDEFRQLLINNYDGEETKIALPKLLSDEYRVDYARADRKGYFFSFIPKECDVESEEYLNQRFYIEIYKRGLTYEDQLAFYKAGHANEVVEYGDTAAYVLEAFIFNNNGMAIIVNIPDSLCELYERDENSPPPITNLDALNEYILIEYLDLSENKTQ